MQDRNVHFRKTLYFKMILLTVLLGAVFFAGLYAVYKKSCERFEEELTYHSDVLTEQICRNVDVSLKELAEKSIPLIITNERLGPILTQIKEQPAKTLPPYLGIQIKNSLDEFIGMNGVTNWIAVIDRRDHVYLSYRDSKNKNSVQDRETLFLLYQENKENLADRFGNTVWIASPNPDSIILMRTVFDSNTMQFCGCIMAEVENDGLRAIFDHIDGNKAGTFILYDRNQTPIYQTVAEHMVQEQREVDEKRNILQAEYLISRGKLRIVHQIDLEEKNQRFSDLLYLIGGIGCLIYVLVIIMLWVMFGNMAKSLKVLSENLIRVSCGKFDWIETNFARGSELDIVSSNVREMSVRIKHFMEEEVKNRELQQQSRYKLLEARYQELQAQVNPHFLFNVLQSLNGIVLLHGDYQASQLIGKLSKFFRGNIDRKYKYCNLYEELEYVKNYLELYKNIYPDRLKIEWKVDETLCNYQIPTYILQPIVENSLVHGMEPKIGICTIRISVERDTKNLIITVWDNGVGISEEKLKGLLKNPENTKRVGIKNVQDRIQLCYGSEYGVKIVSEKNHHTEVKINLPLLS